MRIPKSVEMALLKQRKEINKQAEIFNNHASKTISMVVQAETLDSELEFWNIKNDEKLDEFLLELPYALLLAGSDFDWSKLPEGYAPLSTMLEFELSCQNEGWGAVCNSGEEEMRSVIDAYSYLGLNDEAAALSAVLEKYVEIDDKDEEFHELIGAAYSSVENKTPELEDRLKVVRRFVRDNSQLLATTEH